MKISDTGTLSPDDVQARIGKLTASRMGDAMHFLKRGGESEVRRQLKFDILAERLTNIIVPHYVTSYMLHGIEQEPHAKAAYAALTRRTVRPAGFLDHPTIDLFGATPDGFVDDGLVEFKCPTTSTFMSWALSGEVPDEHKPQMIAQAVVTGKPWIDFCAFDPRMPTGRQLFIRRFTPSSEERRRIEEAAVQFLLEVDEMFEQITTIQLIS